MDSAFSSSESAFQLLQRAVNKTIMDGGDKETNGYDNKREESFNGFISDEALFIIGICCMVVVSPAISAFGILTNIINMTAFIKQGLNDCMSVSLFSLAVTELNQVLWTLFWSMAYAGILFHSKDPYIDYNGLFYLATRVLRVFKLIAILFTVFISLERCLCVVWPFKFKGTFTTNRSVIILAVCTSFVIFTSIPGFFTLELSQQFDPFVNRTRLKLIRTDNIIADAMTSLQNIVVGVGSQIAVLILTQMTSQALRKSMHFRMARTKAVSKSAQFASETTVGTAQVGNSSRASKEVQLTRTIIMMASVFFILRLPEVFGTLLLQFQDGMFLTDRFRNLYLTLGFAMHMPSSVYASFTMLIYYRMNPGYRETLKKMFIPRRQIAAGKG